MGDGAGKAHGGELTPDPTADPTSDVTSDATVDVTTGPLPEASSDLTSDLTPDLTADLTTDELAVRDLLHRAVAGIQPVPGGLPRIRAAVPRRRAARRGALTGALALAAAVAVALPALHNADHLGLSGGPGSPHADAPVTGVPAGTTADGSGPFGASPRPGPVPGTAGQPSGTASSSPSPGASSTRADGGTTAPAAATSSGEGPIVPLCTRGDLGQGTAQAGPADAEGRIYGWFAVTNVSGHACRLGGPGAVSVTAVTGTDRSRIRVTDHTAGDPATGLPLADTDPPLLAPQAGYRVPFAWIPDPVCPTTGQGGATTAPTGAPAPGPVALTTQAPAAASGAPASGASAAPSSNPHVSASPSAGPTTEPTPSGSPTPNPTASSPPSTTIAHTPAPGSPSAAAVLLPGACAGTVYRGGLQPVGGPAAQPSGTPPTG
ncbi:hypothetical protein PUR71_14015 [Streptomyces sp. SP17BM10]|uniref:hypothetical protein n=1 Tax=Streptomyces sp. SP17BM10 TaxID=3002530 RepID=UPI002E760691|nr:hypothetical protein [Streptomyces sp. SP17BM10]MEE1784009.1 hypothetical protein [Streptomyces sp. SP17BM10]